MQTAENRHLSKREKKYLNNPNGRRHLKAAVYGYGKLLGELDPKSHEFEKVKDARSLICKWLSTRRAAKAAA